MAGVTAGPFLDKNGLDALAENVKNNSGYVIAEGKSGCWYYRKWSTGVAECYGYDNIQNPNIDSSYEGNIVSEFDGWVPGAQQWGGWWLAGIGKEPNAYVPINPIALPFSMYEIYSISVYCASGNSTTGNVFIPKGQESSLINTILLESSTKEHPVYREITHFPSGYLARGQEGRTQTNLRVIRSIVGRWKRWEE